MITIHYLKDVSKTDLEGSVFITGYQGFGMVGYLASRHVVRELGLYKIGFIKTRYMPETTFYIDGIGLSYPFELYYGIVDDKKLVVLLNHAIPHFRERTQYAEFISKWVRENGVEYAILLGGLDPSIKESEDEKYRWIPIYRFDKKLDAPILNEKYVVGPLALTMMFMEAYRVSGIAIFAYTEMYRPDPRASAVAVEVIARLLDLRINTEKLLEEAEVIEAIEEERRKLLKMYEGEVKPSRKDYTMHV